MENIKQIRYWLQCIECNAKFDAVKPMDACEACSGLLMVERDEEWIDNAVGTGEVAQQTFDTIRFGKARDQYPNGSGVFQWLSHILPGFPLENVVSLREGETDMYEIPNWLKQKIGLKNLFLKMEGQLPSESFKDRGMSVAVSEALRLQSMYPELGIKGIACASTGDTSAAAALYSGYVRDKLQCVVLVPAEKISIPQLFQSMAHGATVLSLEHPEGFDGCMKLIKEFCARHPEIVLVNSKNPYRIVGQETIALEICQDLRWDAPDWISIPCGNGGNLTSLMVSLLRMKKRGMISKLPGILVAQTKGANTLVRWAQSGFKNYDPGAFKDSVASAMNIQDPVSFPRIQKYINEFEVEFFDVPEESIQRTRALFMGGGANICPQTAVALDAVLQAKEKGVVFETDRIVVLSTASGTKFTVSGIEHHKKGSREDFANRPYVIPGTIEAIEEVIKL